MQHGREERVGYNPIDRLVGVYNDVNRLLPSIIRPSFNTIMGSCCPIALILFIVFLNAVSSLFLINSAIISL